MDVLGRNAKESRRAAATATNFFMIDSGGLNILNRTTIGGDTSIIGRANERNSKSKSCRSRRRLCVNAIEEFHHVLPALLVGRCIVTDAFDAVLVSVGVGERMRRVGVFDERPDHA